MKIKKRLHCWVGAFVALMIVAANPPDSFAVARISMAKAQTVYVPVYSEIFISDKKFPIRLTNFVVIRNVDMESDIQVLSANYYDKKGLLLKNFYPEPMRLAPLETALIYLPEEDKEGGFGANFIIRWNAEKAVNTPIIESLMVGSRGRSFVRTGRVLKEREGPFATK